MEVIVDTSKGVYKERIVRCKECKHWEYDDKYGWWHCPLQDNGMYECHYEPKTEPQKWETPPKFEHKGITTTCVSVPMALIEDEPQTEKHKCRRCLYYDIPSDYYPCSECVDYSNYSGEIETEPQTERNNYHRSKKVCTLELFDDDGVYIEPQTDCDHSCVQTEIGCGRTDCAWGQPCGK